MKIVAFSDTHGEHHLIEDVPEGDVLIFAGDMTKHGRVSEVSDFADWLSQFPHDTKLVVAGNHDFCFDGNQREDAIRELQKREIVYLENDCYQEEGVLFFGSPISATFDRYVFRDEGAEFEVPDDTDVLITHGPPKGVLDYFSGNDHGHVGSEKIKDAKKGMVLQAHVFGHIHEEHGSEVNCYNVSVLDENYDLVNSPTVLEVNL